MKKVIFLSTLFLLLGLFRLQAQIIIGARLITGEFNGEFSSSTINAQNIYTYVNTRLVTGYHLFFKDNQRFSWSVSPEYIYSNNENKTGGSTSLQNKTSGVGVLFSMGYARYFQIKSIHENLFFTLSATASPGYNYTHTFTRGITNDNGTPMPYTTAFNTHYLTLKLMGTPGIAFRLNEKWLLSANMGGASISYSVAINNYYTKNYNADFDLSPSVFGIGVGYFLQGKKTKKD